MEKEVIEEKETFKSKIMNILKNNDFMDKRPSKLSVDDFLKLLYIFNEAEIHFK